VIPRTLQKIGSEKLMMTIFEQNSIWCASIICLEIRHLTSCISRMWSYVRVTEGLIGEGGKIEPNQWRFTWIMPEFTQHEIVSPKFSAWRWRSSRRQPIVRTRFHAISGYSGLQNRPSRMKFWRCWSAHAMLTFDFQSSNFWRLAAGRPKLNGEIKLGGWARWCLRSRVKH
jgi:hypothetical protein